MRRLGAVCSSQNKMRTKMSSMVIPFVEAVKIATRFKKLLKDHHSPQDMEIEVEEITSIVSSQMMAQITYYKVK